MILRILLGPSNPASEALVKKMTTIKTKKKPNTTAVKYPII
jgi:hypothetical protein